MGGGRPALANGALAKRPVAMNILLKGRSLHDHSESRRWPVDAMEVIRLMRWS